MYENGHYSFLKEYVFLYVTGVCLLVCYRNFLDTCKLILDVPKQSCHFNNMGDQKFIRSFNDLMYENEN